MSSHLNWEPKTRSKQGLSSELKFLLRKRYGNPIDTELGKEDLQYLYGIRDTGVDEINKLISAIEQHGEIVLKEEY